MLFCSVPPALSLTRCSKTMIRDGVFSNVCCSVAMNHVLLSRTCLVDWVFIFRLQFSVIFIKSILSPVVFILRLQLWIILATRKSGRCAVIFWFYVIFIYLCIVFLSPCILIITKSEIIVFNQCVFFFSKYVLLSYSSPHLSSQDCLRFQISTDFNSSLWHHFSINLALISKCRVWIWM